MKSARKIAVFAVVFLILGVVLHAEPVSQLRPTGYVNDFAGVLDQSTVTRLNDICTQVDQKANAQIAVVTIKSLDGADIFDYSVSLYQKWGIGKKGSDRGVLILLAIQERRYYTTVGYGLEPILPDGKVGGFGREAVPLLRQSDYGGALLLLTSRIADVIAKDANVELNYSRPAIPTPVRGETPKQVSAGTILFWLVVIVVVLAVPPLRKFLFWWLLLGGGRGGSRGGWGDYGGGGWGGGGFGGGGGGFGGFGGGSTGGGGAGGSW
jgi:uncharacterized protein